ncbi:ROK family protein [Bremerella cremea]|uniref:ROK family protein n=1 Tax=Bremerella cremea TaxID=1031537 RepID=UPI0031E58FD3
MNVIGVEIGGTKLQVALADADSLKTIVSLREEIVPAKGAAGIQQQLQRMIRALQTEYSIAAIGLGFGGPLDATAGVITTSHQVEGWDRFPMVAWCQEQFGLPAVIRNDCDTAALAEATLGAGQGKESSFYVTIGSGIGGGYVHQGQLMGGSRPAFAEIGHLRPGVLHSEPGNTVEAESSGFGISNEVRQWIKNIAPEEQDDDCRDLLARCQGDLEKLTTRDIADAALTGNAICEVVLRDAVETLGWAIAQVITLLAPEVVILGGGVSLMPEKLFRTPLEDQVATYVFPPLAGSYQLVPAQLGEAVVVQGALLLAKQFVS